MPELDQDQNLDTQDDSNQIVPSDDQQQDQNQDTDLDNGDQGNDNQNQNDDGDQRQSRQERRRERFEAFQKAREGFQSTGEQRDQALRRDPYNPLKYDKGTEYDVDQLEKDRTTYGDNRYAQGVEQQRYYDQQERYYDRLEIDSDFVSSKYSYLDEESDDFDPDLSSTINELFFEAAGYDPKTHVFRNPNVRYKPFVQRYVKAMEKFAAIRNADSASNLESQRGRTGVRPSGNGGRRSSGSHSGIPSQMTDEELDAQIAHDLGLGKSR